MEPPRGNKRNPPLNHHQPPPPPNWQPPPNHHQPPPPPNWQPPPNRYYTPPPPSTHYSQTHQQQYYTPQPASPAYGYNMGPPPMVEPHHIELAQSSNFGAFDDLATDDVVPETPNPTPSATPTEEEDDDDEVEECDARGKKKFVGRKPREVWTEEQEVALAQAWIQISECKKFGNEQKAEGFWKRVLQRYASTLGSISRTFHSLTTKWKVMNAEMGNFNGLWIQAFRAKGSGCNDLDITTTALSDYYTKMDKHFTHIPAWKVVKDHDKWKHQECFSNIVGMGIPTSSGSSKRKSSDFAEASNDNVLPDMNEDPCRPAAKKDEKEASCIMTTVI